MTRMWNWMIAKLGEERGQATVEYFLVILAAAALAVIALRLAQSGTSTSLIGDLFARVLRWVIGRF
jgi:hypothetical protein